MVLDRGVEAVVGALLLLASFAMRLVNIDRYSGSYPEGIRAEQLLLMSAGFRPFKDIFSDQGPWLLHALYPGFVVFGESLAGVRSTVVLASLLGLGGVYWLARLVAGPLAALTALTFLGFSPLYLKFSRLAVAELLALAPAILALGCAVRFGQIRRQRWLYAAGLCLAVSLLLKPITIGTALPVALAIWLAGGARVRHLCQLGLVTVGAVLSGVLLVGMVEVFEQIVAFRSASRVAESWSLIGNWNRLRRELAGEWSGLGLLAGAGAVLSLSRPRLWPMLLWTVASLGTLLAHAPLHTKHFAIVVVPLATLGAVGLAEIARIAGRTGTRAARWGARASLVVATVVFATNVPTLRASHWELLTSNDLFDRDEARLWYGDAIRSLERVSEADEYVLSDHTYLAFGARRLVPPELVEASATRVRAGSLSDDIAIGETERHETGAVLLWADKLVGLKRYRQWLTEHYEPTKVWAAEGDTRPVLWLRRGRDTTLDRASLRQVAPGFHEQRALFGSWRLVGASVSSHHGAGEVVLDGFCADPRARLSVTLEWETANASSPDGRVKLALSRLSPARETEVDTEQEPLLGFSERPAWISWVGAMTVPLEAGQRYRLTARLLDERGRSLGEPLAIREAEARPC